MGVMLAVILVAITCMVNLSLGLLVVLRNPARNVGISFFLVSLFVSMWAISNLLTGAPDVGLGVNSLFNRIAFLAAFLAVAASLWFSAIFPRPTHRSGRFVTLLIVLGTVVAFLSVTSLVAGEVSLSGEGLHFTVGPLLPFYIATIALFLALLVTNLVQAYRKTHGQVQLQAMLILIAFAFPIVLGLVSNAILPVITSDWQSANIGPAFTVIMVGLISFAIIRHHLFDIRLALARSFAYVLSVGAIAALYIIIAFSISTIFLGGRVSVVQEIFFAIFSGLVALMFQPIKKLFDKASNKLFYRDAYDAQSFVDQLNRSLVSYTDLDRLLIETSTIIRDNFKAEFCLFHMADPSNKGQSLTIGSDNRSFSLDDMTVSSGGLPRSRDKVIVADGLTPEYSRLKRTLESKNVALMVHLSSRQGSSDSFGYLVVGNKKSGNPYNQQDVQMLNILANGLVIALQNAFRFEEIQTFNLTLKQKVDNATKELRKTNDRLRLLDQTKDDFISMASHQLRTPLTSVRGYVSMVLDGDGGPINETQRKLLTQSFLSSQRMVYLISDLLNVSRLKTGKFLIEPVESDMAKVIAEEVDQLAETVKGRNLVLTYHKPDNFPMLMLDETKMRQVIMNFIDNAIYYTSSGGHIDVRLVEKPESIEFTVVDDGIGVPREEQHHLFGKFYRAHNAKSARPDGTGLGLFMAKKVVIAQGGATIFRSTEGKGSTFGFTFPKAKVLAKVAPKS